MSYVVTGRLYALCDVTVRYTLRCVRCDAIAAQEMRIRGGQDVAWGEMPSGWHVVDGYPFCPDHTVQVSDT